MDINALFKGLIDADLAPIVICDLNHEIVYMNPTALKRYEKRGGSALIGKSLLGCHNEKSVEMIERVVKWFGESKDNGRVFTFRNDKENKDVYMVALRDLKGELIGYYEKHEYRTHEEGEPYKELGG